MPHPGRALAVSGPHYTSQTALSRHDLLPCCRVMHLHLIGDNHSKTDLTKHHITLSQVAVDMEVEDINAHLTRLDGLEMLEKLRRQGRLAEVLQPALPLSDAIAADGSDGSQAAGGGGSQPAGGSLA